MTLNLRAQEHWEQISISCWRKSSTGTRTGLLASRKICSGSANTARRREYRSDVAITLKTWLDKDHGHLRLLQEDGEIKCTCPVFKMKKPQEAASCPHVSELLNSGQDVVNTTGSPISLPAVTKVPFIRKPECVAELEIGSGSFKGQAREVALKLAKTHYDYSARQSHVTFNRIILGVVLPGDGRKILHAMLLDWLICHFDERPKCRETICQAPDADDLLIETEHESGKRRFDNTQLADAYYRFTQNLCLYCWQQNQELPF